ncbi:hypothetical protein WUBG_07556 [Wuchereria bancrofti]|uniref:Uncharacterized protein n=1 Tax=Wuchereria bancrofti TaxID=6293 RepID=J9EGH3_WUCBA|nr:hypothetical protein WUBG_07556 [Wuchereria bancrofti]
MTVLSCSTASRRSIQDGIPSIPHVQMPNSNCCTVLSDFSRLRVVQFSFQPLSVIRQRCGPNILLSEHPGVLCDRRYLRMIGSFVVDQSISILNHTEFPL